MTFTAAKLKHAQFANAPALNRSRQDYLPVPHFLESTTTLAALRALVKSALDLLQALSPSDFFDAHKRTIHEKAGAVPIELPAERFLHEFALPNFFFHLNMAYALARMHGCVLGKAAYDGFHVYKSEA